MALWLKGDLLQAELVLVRVALLHLALALRSILAAVVDLGVPLPIVAVLAAVPRAVIWATGLPGAMLAL